MSLISKPAKPKRPKIGRTIRQPWSDAARTYFELPADTPDPDYYKVRYNKHTQTLTCTHLYGGVMASTIIRTRRGNPLP